MFEFLLNDGHNNPLVWIFQINEANTWEILNENQYENRNIDWKLIVTELTPTWVIFNIQCMIWYNDWLSQLCVISKLSNTRTSFLLHSEMDFKLI